MTASLQTNLSYYCKSLAQKFEWGKNKESFADLKEVESRIHQHTIELLETCVEVITSRKNETSFTLNPFTIHKKQKARNVIVKSFKDNVRMWKKYSHVYNGTPAYYEQLKTIVNLTEKNENYYQVSLLDQLISCVALGLIFVATNSLFFAFTAFTAALIISIMFHVIFQSTKRQETVDKVLEGTLALQKDVTYQKYTQLFHAKLNFSELRNSIFLFKNGLGKFEVTPL